MCISFWSFGECGQGVKCPNRHPVQVCIKYLNNTCVAGGNCVNQHPKQSNFSSKPNAFHGSLKHPSSPMIFEEQRSPFHSRGVTPPNTNQNIPSVSIPSFFPSAPTHLSAQTHRARSPVHHSAWPQMEQQHDRYDQQHRQGNEHGHLGQQQGQGWQN